MTAGAGFSQCKPAEVYTGPVNFKRAALTQTPMSDCADANLDRSAGSAAAAMPERIATHVQHSVASNTPVQPIASPPATPHGCISKFDFGPAPAADGHEEETGLPERTAASC